MRGAPLIPMVILFVFVITGIFGRFFLPHDPTEMDLMAAEKPPFWMEQGSVSIFLGADDLGRDMLSRLIGGAGVSLQVGFVVVCIAGSIGSIIALLSGFIGGWVDAVLMMLTDMFLSLPYLLIAIVLAAVLGPSKNNIILILAILGWAGYARVLRSEVLRIKNMDFVNLARVAGCSNFRIMGREIFPNIVNTLIIMATLQVGAVIIAESSISFLGLGVPPPEPAWGTMVADGRDFLTTSWWICLWPGLAILFTVLSCNLLGDWLRLRMDPKFRQI
ncbi:MAG: ABC transporter permease [Desulfobacteraceae bacterium]|nr:ABC transporter permease [Desulfobacteraceae bacterium]